MASLMLRKSCFAQKFNFGRSLMMMSTTTFTPQSQPHFNKFFQLPPRTDIFHLETTNSHPEDAKITFDEAEHKYSYEGQPVKSSVTTVIGHYFEQFDSEAIAEKMINGANWPRDGYKHKDGTAYTKEQIVAKWDSGALYARNQGTWMHHNIERILNNLPPMNFFEEKEQFDKFYADNIEAQNITPYRTEWRICAPDLGIAGSVDFVGKLPDGSVVLMDWKRAKNLEGSLTDKFGKMGLGPLNHLAACDANKYSIQLNVYKYILENYYGLTVSKMVCASFHPAIKNGEYFALDIQSFDKEASNVIKDFEADFNSGILGTTAGYDNVL